MGKYVVQRMKWANLFEIPFSSHMPIFVKNKEKKGHTLMQSTQFSLETYECISAHKRPNKGEILLSIIDLLNDMVKTSPTTAIILASESI